MNLKGRSMLSVARVRGYCWIGRARLVTRKHKRKDVVENQGFVQPGSFKSVKVLDVDVGELLSEVVLRRRLHSLKQ